jgi:AraC-like DNA-binding protein
VRLRTLIQTYPQAKNLTDVALGAGYFDQSHFIKDFTAFTGTTPKDFFSALSPG